MKEEYIKVIICEADKAAYTKVIPYTGDHIREIIGGPMESHHPCWPERTKDARDLYVICNEEGKNLDLPRNRALLDDEGNVYDILHGTFLICGLDRSSGWFCSLSPAQEEIAMRTFGMPEKFIEDGTGTVHIFQFLPSR